MHNVRPIMSGILVVALSAPWLIGADQHAFEVAALKGSLDKIKTSTTAALSETIVAQIKAMNIDKDTDFVSTVWNVIALIGSNAEPFRGLMGSPLITNMVQAYGSLKDSIKAITGVVIPNAIISDLPLNGPFDFQKMLEQEIKVKKELTNLFAKYTSDRAAERAAQKAQEEQDEAAKQDYLLKIQAGLDVIESLFTAQNIDVVGANKSPIVISDIVAKDEKELKAFRNNVLQLIALDVGFLLRQSEKRTSLAIADDRRLALTIVDNNGQLVPPETFSSFGEHAIKHFAQWQYLSDIEKIATKNQGVSGSAAVVQVVIDFLKKEFIDKPKSKKDFNVYIRDRADRLNIPGFKTGVRNQYFIFVQGMEDIRAYIEYRYNYLKQEQQKKAKAAEDAAAAAGSMSA